VEKLASREKIEGPRLFFGSKSAARTSQNTKRRLKNGTGEKNRRRHARVGDVSRVTDGAFLGHDAHAPKCAKHDSKYGSATQ